MVPAALRCEACGVRVEGPVAVNEFAALSTDDLHFLRIFVHCEGSIREMEAALGVSYPTIKARLARLKERLTAAPAAAPAETMGVLMALERGEISAEEAVEKVRAGRAEGAA